MRCLLYRVTAGACEAGGVWSRLDNVVKGDVVSFSERIFEIVGKSVVNFGCALGCCWWEIVMGCEGLVTK